jgi:hypothetical protein
MKENKSSKITRKRQMLLIRKEKNMNCAWSKTFSVQAAYKFKKQKMLYLSEL